MPKILSDKYKPWALIVGGSEGVGEAFAHRLAAQGFNMVLTSYLAAPLERVAGDISKSSNVEIISVVHDLTTGDPLAPVTAVTDGLDIGLMIYTAGSVGPMPSFVDTPLDQVLRPIRLNAIGQTSFAHHYGALMKKRGGGGMIIIGSNAGMAGIGGLATYAASKAYTQIFAEGLWMELKEHNIDVLVPVLGATRTPFLARIGAPIDDPNFKAAYPDDIAAQALDRLGDGPTVLLGDSEDWRQMVEAGSRADAVRRATARVSGLELHEGE